MSDTSTIHDDEALWQQPHNPWLIALVVTMATFMEVLDTSVANVSLPHIAGNLSVGVDESTWVLTSYLVSNAVILPLSGWLSERIGRKRFYMSCVALFTTSSLLCGFAPNLAMLVFFRVLQGAGGGGLQPSEQAILADTFPPSKRGMAFAVYGMAVVAAPALGPTLGGWITDNFTWRWIFFINVPVGILSLILTSRLISDPPYLKEKKKRSSAKIDYIGFGLIAVGLGFLQVVLDKGQREDWFQSNYICVFTVIFVTALILAVIWELHVGHPVVDLRLFRDRTFLMANIMLFAVGFVLYSTTVLLPQYSQELMGYTAERSGMLISPGGVTIMLLMPLIGFLVSRYDARKIIAFGFLIVGLATLHMMRFNLGVDFRTMMWARVFQAGGVAFLFVPINTAAYAYLPREKNNAASGLINLARNIGGSVGISLVTTALARRAQFHQSVLVSHLTPYNGRFIHAVHALGHDFASSGAGTVTAAKQAYGAIGMILARQSMLLAYLDNFWLLGLTALVLIPFTFLMKKSKTGGPIAVH
ncbi:MAG TPA: DHA2 family efflux MFS transporter permease subunit [Verrucomicrobiae bacterium]|nr:DHA2 family efflux MFS transporter permease subunit [Verrucomicrobiae bacterium]